MIVKNARKVGVLALLVAVVATIVPQAALAVDPPAFISVLIFGNSKPGDPDFGDPVFGGQQIYPMSLPYGANFERGLLYVTGRAFPGAGSTATSLFIDVGVTDVNGGPPKVTRTVTTRVASDPNGPQQGDFNAELRITDLGVHQVTNPLGTPAERGESTLYVTLTARDTSVSPALTTNAGPITIVKHAGVPTGCAPTQLCPADTTAPSLSRLVWPPSNWCHTSGPNGINLGSGGTRVNVNLGGNGQGNCGTLAPLPDLTWVPCAVTPPIVPTRPFMCSRPSQGEYMPHGFAQVTGEANDDVSDARGVASEIYRIRIQMTQGTTVLRDFDDILRSGPKANWSWTLSINDYDPNPMGPPYVVRVIAEDAYGNTTTAQSPNITIWPW